DAGRNLDPAAAYAPLVKHDAVRRGRGRLPVARAAQLDEGHVDAERFQHVERGFHLVEAVGADVLLRRQAEVLAQVAVSVQGDGEVERHAVGLLEVERRLDAPPGSPGSGHGFASDKANGPAGPARRWI